MSDSVNSNPVRVGNITSSQIHRLMSFGKRDMTLAELADRPKSGKGSATKFVIDKTVFGEGALTYIKELNRARKIGRSVKNDVSAVEFDWGHVCELYCDETRLGTEYSFVGNESETHPDPELDFWAGSPDLLTHRLPRKVGDIKSPFSLSSFCDFADCNTIEEVRENHSDGEAYYFQLLSNACIFNCDYAELIIFCPYQDELATIRERARELGYDRIVWKKNDMELPYLIREVSKYPSVVRFEFEVTQAMKDELTEVVKRAGSLLIPR